MGTPEFSVPSLEVLAKSEFEVAAVLVQPDRPTGRGRKVSSPPVKISAQEHGLPVLQPIDTNAAASLDYLREKQPDLFVVVAYGCILSPELLSIPELGSINLHASLLPEYRGASPVQSAILDGRKETGVSTMWMDNGIDTGDVIYQEKLAVGVEETAGELSDRLASMGASLLLRTVQDIANKTAPRTPQDLEVGTYCKKIKKSEGVIDWSRAAADIVLRIRAMTPRPGALARIKTSPADDAPVHSLRIEKARVSAEPRGDARPGEVWPSSGGGVIVATDAGNVELVTVRPAGKRSMAAADWWRGLRTERARFLGLDEDG